MNILMTTGGWKNYDYAKDLILNQIESYVFITQKFNHIQNNFKCLIKRVDTEITRFNSASLINSTCTAPEAIFQRHNFFHRTLRSCKSLLQNNS